jgi:hypothetical protein
MGRWRQARRRASADGSHGDQTGGGHSFQFTLQRAAPGQGKLCNFVGVERSVRLTKQQPKHPLLASREKHI